MASLLDQAKEHYNLARYDAAGAALEAVLAAEPQNVDALLLLGMVLEKQDNLPLAAEIFAHALGLSPNQKKNIGLRAVTHFIALNNTPKALETLMKLHDLMPDDKDVVHAICSVYREANRYGEAAPFAHKLAQLADGFAGWLNAGIVLSGLGKLNEAYDLLAKAHKARPEERLALCEYFWCASSLCEFETADRLQALLLDGLARDGDKPDIRESAFRALMWSGDEDYLAKAGLRTAQGLFQVAPKSKTYQRSHPRRPGRLRIGYVSNDFYDHATMTLIAGVLEAHDRANFEIFTFCYTEQQNRKGAMRQRFLASCEHMIDILDVPDDLVIQAVRELDIDILVDLKGFTQGSRLSIFAAKAAPIQITWLGFPGTVQGAGMDYAITDRFVTPPASDAFFEEKLLRMPMSYQCNDAAREPVARVGSRADHGLPDDAIVFCSFNQAVKIRTPILKAWMEILQRVEKSVLWIGQLNNRAKENLKNAAIASGLDPARLIFAETVPIADHLRRLPQADIALDTAPCNGHTTTSDALWAGVPVITVKGTSFAGRVSESLLNTVGLPDLVAEDLSAYVELAVNLAQDQTRMSELNRVLVDGRKTLPLFDSNAFCRDLEGLYRSVLTEERLLQE